MDLKQYQQLIEESCTRFSKALPASPASLYEPIRYTLSHGGKRLRPLLTLMGAGLFRDDVRCALPAATGIELFHNFTLLHDDIMDNAPLRRGKASVHAKWNKSVAILSGDAMYTEAFRQVAQSPPDALTDVLEIFTSTALKVCEGQQLDMDFETRANVSIAEYLEMISLKTAALLAGALEIGARCAGADMTEAKKLYAFGLHIGLAFQLQDDILDVYGDAEKFGKQVGGDIVANKKTYLLLKAFENANRYQKEELKNWSQASVKEVEEKVRGVKALYDALDVRTQAEEELRRHFDAGLQALESVNGNPEGKKAIRAFAESLMVREY